MKNSKHVSRFSSKKLLSLVVGCIIIVLIVLWLNKDNLKTSRFKKRFRAPDANLILISFDTLRADRLGCYGNPRATSPAIDSLADRGVRFANVVAESSWTLPSHMTIMTGLYPATHRVNLPINRLPDNIQTLAQTLDKNGYSSNAITCGGWMHSDYGFGRGFEQYDHTMKSFQSTVEKATQWIEDLPSDKPFFLFLHTYDIHCPYNPPEEYGLLFRTRPPEDYIETEGKCGNPYFNSVKLNPGQVTFLLDQYDANIKWADDSLHNFLLFLESRNAFENTVIVFLSDHGEEFKEHGQIGHEKSLYIESLKVPLIIVAPGLKPRVVKELTGLADVMPTLLKMLDVDSPSMDGSSLLPLMTRTRKKISQKPVFSELHRTVNLRSLVYGSDHFIFNISNKQRKYYNLAKDPKEQINLLEKDPVRAKELSDMLLTHYDDVLGPEAFLDRKQLDKQTEVLRGLGYIE